MKSKLPRDVYKASAKRLKMAAIWISTLQMQSQLQ